MNSFLASWGGLRDKLENARIFLFLDFDGTISPIAPTPREARLPADIKTLLRKLSRCKDCKIAIISGRPLKDIKKKVGLKKIIYAGNHGFEINGAGLEYKVPISRIYRKTLLEIRKVVTRKISAIKGALIEDKGYSLAIHYRCVKKCDLRIFRAMMRRILKPYLAKKTLCVKDGKMVFELTAPKRWDKGRAVKWLLNKSEHSVRKRSIVPVYIGDDLTDEDAFRALKNNGITVVVKKPGHSCAKYYVTGISGVASLLKKVARLKGIL